MKISRRNFNATILASLLEAAMGRSASLHGAEETQQDLERSARRKGQKFKATGFFRLEKTAEHQGTGNSSLAPESVPSKRR